MKEETEKDRGINHLSSPIEKEEITSLITINYNNKGIYKPGDIRPKSTMINYAAIMKKS